MSIRFQADNDLKKIVIDATLRREPGVDFQTAQAAGLDRLGGELVPQRESKRTMPPRLAAFVARGGNCPGILPVVPQHAPTRDVAETLGFRVAPNLAAEYLVLIWAHNRPDEWVNLITKTPF